MRINYSKSEIESRRKVQKFSTFAEIILGMGAPLREFILERNISSLRVQMNGQQQSEIQYPAKKVKTRLG